MAAIGPAAPAVSEARAGLTAGLAAYLLWGFLPLLFDAIRGIAAPVVVADRTLFSLLLVGAILLFAGRLSEVRPVLRDGPALRALLLSALILATNWTIYIWAVETDQVLEASFGYFINPLMNVALGMLFLGERQNRWQAVAIGIALVALVVQAIGLGGIPFVALSVALTFAVYGFIRKTVRASSATGLFVETLLLAPLALGYLAYTFIAEGGIGQHADPGTFGLLLLTGPATAVPLLLFAFAVQRLRLTTVGMLQYIAPSIAFVLAITVFGERLNPVRAVSFGLIWLSLAVYTADSVLRRRRGRAADSPAPGA